MAHPWACAALLISIWLVFHRSNRPPDRVDEPVDKPAEPADSGPTSLDVAQEMRLKNQLKRRTPGDRKA